MSKKLSELHLDTQLVDIGRNPLRDSGSVNPPVHRTSTVLFKDFAEMVAYEEGRIDHYGYGRNGSPTIQALEESLALLEGADHALVTASGLAAITLTLLAMLSAGDHVLFPDSIYGSARRFIDHELTRTGVEVQYYDPTIGGGIEALMKPATKMVYCESPGSLTFEMQDIPAIAKVAHAHGAVVVADNTWATPLFQRPFALGVDVSIHAVTKYIGGHSDLVMGAVLCTNAHYKRLKQGHRNLGAVTSGDNAYLALRGLRTLAVRLKRHQAHALQVAEWLETVPEVKRVLFPALPSDPGHALWKRDMSGASGLLAIELGVLNDTQIGSFTNGLEHFGMGYSWGGYESLVTAYRPAQQRVATRWEKDTVLARLHIGLEDPEDLLADLAAGFERLRKAT